MNGQQKSFLQQDILGRTALHYGALSNNDAVLVLLLGEISKIKNSLTKPISMQDNDCFTPLHFSCYYGKFHCEMGFLFFNCFRFKSVNK